MMNLTDEMTAADAKKVKAMRTSVGWFSSPSCALIYQCSKYVALYSSKGYAISAKFRQWLDAELHGKEVELTCWRSAALATTPSSSARPTPSAFR
eukprot:5353040-Pleurochrysis_carterae.AAC.1